MMGISAPKATLVFLILVFVVGCSKNEDVAIECPPTLDMVEVLLSEQEGERDYYLVRRVSGWHDKTIVIQLFDQKPRLDACKQDLVTPIFEDSIGTDKPLLTLKADIEQQDFQLIYGEASAEVSEITLEIAY